MVAYESRDLDLMTQELHSSLLFYVDETSHLCQIEGKTKLS